MPTDPWAAFRIAPDDFSDVQSGRSSSAGGADPWAAFRVQSQAPAEEEQFPTPGQTAETMLSSGLRAIPGMVMGGLEAAAAPVMAAPREAMAYLSGDESPTMRQLRDSYGHLKAASETSARDPEGLAHVVSAVPVAGPAIVGAVRGAGKILTPAYRTATEGAQAITTQEMKQAAEAGGEGVAMLALPELVKGAGKITPKTAGNVLKFAVTGGLEAPVKWLAKRAIGDFILKPAMRELGTILQDSILEAVRKGDVPKAAEVIAKATEKHPAAAQALTESLHRTEAASAAPVASGPAKRYAWDQPLKPSEPTPYAGPYTGAWDAPRRAPSAPAAVAPEVPPAPVRPAIAPKGQSRIPTIFTKPKTGGTPAGKPLTAKARALQLQQLQAAHEAGVDIFDAFGMDKTTTGAAAGGTMLGPKGTKLIQVVGPKGDRIVIAAKRGAKGGSDFDPLTASKAGKHELQPDKITRRIGTDAWKKALEEAGFSTDEAIGFAHFGPGEAELTPGMVYVSPELQRSGIATAMYDAARSATGLGIKRGAVRPEGLAFRNAYDSRGH